MRRFLSIVIPRYSESEKDIFPLLSSISTQVGIDFNDIEVIVCNDGGGTGTLSDDFKKIFCYEIRELISEENKGPGVMRQIGIDNANGEYVMFCDADDRLHNVGVLGGLMQAAEKNAPDIIRTSWLEEIMGDDGKCRYVTHERDNTWMFGKLFRRFFLIENDIRFHDDLRVHEDSYFMQLASSFVDANDDSYEPVTSYIWNYNPNSITRRDNEIYSYSSLPEYIRAMSLAHEKVEKRMPGRAKDSVLHLIPYIYFTVHLPHWLEECNKGYRKDVEEAFAQYIRPMWHYWKEATEPELSTAYNHARSNTYSDCMETETIWEWLDRLGLNDK